MPNRNKTTTPIKYLVTDNKGQFVVEVPANWRMTFGAVNPGTGDRGYENGKLHCLRIWEGEKLRAVHCNVQEFRDLSIPLARKVDRQTGTATWTMDSAGNFEESRKVAIEEGEFQLEAIDGNAF